MLPKKQFGQNFLTSIPAQIAIGDAGELNKGDKVLEIGPGKGFLTKDLLKRGAHVTALEKDRDLLPILTETFNIEISEGRLSLVEGDVLKFDPDDYGLKASAYKLIANIPYYITGAIISRFLSQVNQPSMMVILIQKEVAERIVARGGKESLLSLSVKVYGSPKIVYRVSKGSFFPIPKVDSAVLQIKDISHKNFSNQYHEEMFFKVIHAAFAHKRKFSLSNLKEVFKSKDIESLFQECSIEKKARAEDVTLSQWLQLSSKLSTL